MKGLAPLRQTEYRVPQMADRKLVNEIRSTSKRIGRVVSVLVNPKGEVIDGYHRLQANGKWPKRTLRLDALQTRVARLVINRTRRTANIRDYEELARFLHKTEPGKDRYHVKNGKTIAARITELTGIPYRTVMDHIGGSKYVGPTKPLVKVAGSATLDKGVQRSQKPQSPETKGKQPEIDEDRKTLFKAKLEEVGRKHGYNTTECPHCGKFLWWSAAEIVKAIL